MYAATIDYGRTLRRRPEPPSRRRFRKAAIGAGSFVLMAIVLAQTAHGSTPGGVETVTVSPGQTLWGIAAERYPTADTRDKVIEIERLNALAGPGLRVGETLKVPAA